MRAIIIIGFSIFYSVNACGDEPIPEINAKILMEKVLAHYTSLDSYYDKGKRESGSVTLYFTTHYVNNNNQYRYERGPEVNRPHSVTVGKNGCYKTGYPHNVHKQSCSASPFPEYKPISDIPFLLFGKLPELWESYKNKFVLTSGEMFGDIKCYLLTLNIVNRAKSNDIYKYWIEESTLNLIHSESSYLSSHGGYTANNFVKYNIVKINQKIEPDAFSDAPPPPPPRTILNNLFFNSLKHPVIFSWVVGLFTLVVFTFIGYLHIIKMIEQDLLKRIRNNRKKLVLWLLIISVLVVSMFILPQDGDGTLGGLTATMSRSWGLILLCFNIALYVGYVLGGFLAYKYRMRN